MLFYANSTTQGLVWQPEPDGRGSFGILSSCLLTLTLCVWTSVHPNVGFQRRPMFDWSHAESRMALLVIALGAPEYMIFFSWSQNYAARYLDREAGIKNVPFVGRMRNFVLNAFREHPRTEAISCSEHGRPLTQWTSTHSIFACMGGFVFDTTENEPFLPDPETQMTLTPEGVAFVMKHAPELIPDLSQDEILDKSKADRLSKTIACLQAIWFCLQIAARAAQHLPVSLLELTTLAHAFCMFVAYMLWWNKPFEVEQPVIIPAGTKDIVSREMLAYLTTYSTRYDPAGGTLHSVVRHDVLHDEQPCESLDNALRPSVDALDVDDGDKTCCLNHTEYAGSQDRIRDLRRQALTSRAIRRFGLREQCVQLGDAVQTVSTSKMEYSVTLNHISGRPFRILRLTVAIAGYGAIHISAWNHFFPSTTCQVLWRFSTVFITVAGIAQSFRGVTMTLLQGRKNETLSTTKNARLGSKPEYYTDMLNLFKIIAFDSPLYGYAIAGVLIWVVCFIDFAHLPSKAFLDISWSKFMPHFD